MKQFGVLLRTPINRLGEHQVAKKSKIKRKEYTNDEVKLIKAHSKCSHPCRQTFETDEEVRRFAETEGARARCWSGSSAVTKEKRLRRMKRGGAVQDHQAGYFRRAFRSRCR